MEENDLFDKIYAHKSLVNSTARAIVSAHYLIHYLEDPSFSSRDLFSAALKKNFDLLSLDEYEEFMIENEPYWEVYEKLFLRYKRLDKNGNLKN